MNAKKTLLRITLGACALGLSVFGSPKNPVERSIRGCAQGTAVITFNENGIPVSIVTTFVGRVMHMGLVTGGLNATFNENGVPVGVFTLTAANGDQVFGLSGGQGAVFTGGTGRFEGASGSWTNTELIFGPPMPGPILGTVIQEFSSCEEGTIVY